MNNIPAMQDVMEDVVKDTDKGMKSSPRKSSPRKSSPRKKKNMTVEIQQYDETRDEIEQRSPGSPSVDVSTNFANALDALDDIVATDEKRQEVEKSLAKTQRELAESREMNRVLAEQMKLVQIEMKKFKSGDNSISQKYDKMKTKLTSLTGVLEDLTMANQALLARNKELERQIKQLTSQESGTESNAKFKSMVGTLSKKIEEIQEEEAKTRAKNANLETELAALKGVLDVALKKTKQAHEATKEARDENTLFARNERMNIELSGLQQQLEESNSTKDRKIKDLQKTNQELQAKVAASVDELEMVKKALATQGDLQMKNVLEELTATKSEHERVLSQVKEDAQKRVEEAEKVAKNGLVQLAELQVQRDNAFQFVREELTGPMEAEKVDFVKSHAAEMESLREAVKAFDAERKQIHEAKQQEIKKVRDESLVILRNALEDARKNTTKRVELTKKDYEGRIETLRAEKEELQQSSALLKDAIDLREATLKEKVASLEAENSNLNEEIDSSTKKLSETEVAMEAMKKEQDALNEEKEVLEKKCESLQETVESTQQELTSAKETILTLQEEMKALNERVTQYATKYQSTQDSAETQKLQSVEEAVESLAKTTAELFSSEKTLKEQNAELSEEVTKLGSDYADADKEIQELKAKIERYEDPAKMEEHMQQKADRLTEEIRELRESFDQQGESYAQQKAEDDAKIMELQSELSKAKEAASKAEEAAANETEGNDDTSVDSEQLDLDSNVDSKYNKLVQKNNELKNQISVLQKEQLSENDKALQEIASLQANIKSEVSNQALQATIDELKQSNIDLQRKNESLTAELSKSQNRPLGELVQEYQRQQQDEEDDDASLELNAFPTSKPEESQGCVGIAHPGAQNCVGLTPLGARVFTSMASLATFGTGSGPNGVSVTNDVNELQEKLDVLQMKNEALEETIIVLKASEKANNSDTLTKMAEILEQKKQMIIASTQIVELNAVNAELETEIVDLKQKLEDQTQSKETLESIADLTSKLESSEKTNAELLSENTKLQSGNPGDEDLQATLELCQRNLAEEKETNKEMKDLLGLIESENKDMKADLELSQLDLQRHKNKTEVYQKLIAKLNKVNEGKGEDALPINLIQDLEKLELQKAELSLSVSTLQKKLEEMTEDRDAARGEVGMLSSKIRELQSVNAASEKILNDLKATTKDKMRQLQVFISNLEKSNKEKASELAQLRKLVKK